MWEIVDTYLTDLAALINVPREQLKMFRGRTEITQHNTAWTLMPGSDAGSNDPIYVNLLVTGEKQPQRITMWQLLAFPGCCAFCISTGVYVYNTYQRKGVNTRSNKFRQDVAKATKHAALICTDIIDNIGERRTLEKNGWADLLTVRNPKTNNTVALSVKELV